MILIFYGKLTRVKIVYLKKYNISYICKSLEAELSLRRRKWGFGHTYNEAIIDLQLCSEKWQIEKIKIYPEEYIYNIPISTVLQHIKQYRSMRRFLGSWWVDEVLQRPLTGEEKWHYLKESMTKYGWDINQPGCIKIRSSKPPIVVNGNHRISIANELNFVNIPINFLYS